MIAVSLLQTIFISAQELEEICQQARANREQCTRLSQRTQLLVAALSRQWSDTTSQPMISALTNFAIFVEDCIEFMSEFIHAGFIKRLLNNGSYSRRFRDLHETLTSLEIDLTTYVLLERTFLNDSVDQRDPYMYSAGAQQILGTQMPMTWSFLTN